MEIGISAGEASGAFLASELLAVIGEAFPQARYVGTGFLARSQDRVFEDWTNIAVNGFVPVLRVLPRLWKLRQKWLNWLQNPGPKLLILIDYPGFNLKLLKWAQKHQVQVIYLAPPQVWIWKAHRIQRLREVQCLCLFEHEHQYLQQRGIPSIEVGHPFYQNLQSSVSNDGDKNKVLLMPGSRWTRLQQQLPAFLKLWNQALNPHLKEFELSILVPDSMSTEQIRLLECQWKIPVVQESELDLGRVAYAWTIPGTVTLKYALRELPMVILSRLSPWSRFLAQRLQKRGFVFGLHSQLAGVQISEEWIVQEPMPTTIYLNQDQRLMQIQKCKELKEKLLQRPHFRNTLLEFFKTKV